MKMPWFRRFLPLLLLLLLLHVFAVESLSQPKDATESTGVSQPVPPHRGGGPNSYGGTQETQPGNERVQSAWTSLRESKIAFPRPHKPSSLVGYAWLYAKEAFRVLFLNAPISDAHGRRIHPTLTGPVRELNIAAKEDRNPDAMFLLAEMNFHGNFTHPRNFKVASEWYQELASLTGNNTAQYMLGLMYATGIGGAVERDQAKALMYHTFAAEAGNTRSEMTLAYRSHIGIGTPRDCDQATHYYKRVADKAMEYYRSGLPGGRTMDRELYRWADDEGGVYGEGASMSSSKIYVNRDVHSSAEASLDDVLEYLDLMARKGELRPTFNLAKMHYDGARNMPRNYRKAMKYFRLVTKRYWNKDGSVNPNHPRGIGKMASRAAGHIGLMYLRGEGVEQNFGTALTWFKRGLANGDPLCQHEIGLMYLEGYGVLQDAVRASSYFKAAADQDFPASQTRLGALFLDQGDVAAAARYFDLAARYAWVEAFYYLAEIANYGIGRHRHCGMAAAYYKMVAERAEAIHTSFPEANAAYENGDLESALIASTLAAEQGYENAQSNVAYLLDEQRSVLSLDSVLSFGEKTRPSLLRNAALALIYWTRSSKQANIDSLIKMGDYYLSGFGASPDAEKASLCYHTAAEAYHSSQAYWNLGWMHENGVSVDRDFHMAKRYYDLALETNEVAYLPVKLALLKLRARAWWDRITYGKVNPIQEEREPVPNRSFREWMAAFIKNDEEEEARYRAQLFNQRGEFEDDEVLAASTDPHLENHHDDGYYDDLELDIDESFLEGLIIVALAATLLVLVYLRQQRNRRRENENNAAAGAGGVNPGNPGNGDIDRGFFPRPGEPEFAQWVAGGIGH